MRFSRTALVAPLLAVLPATLVTVVAPPGAAQEVRPSAVVLPARGLLGSDGSVDITMKVRCSYPEQAFEWSIDVRQGATYGNDYDGPTAGLIRCNGRWQRIRTHVDGANGPYHRGRATVQALVQLGDAGGGGDTELEDRRTVRIR